MVISANSQTKTSCNDDACCKKSNQTAFVCKLTSPELRKRKATVLASLKNKVVEKKELENGFAYKFTHTDNTVAELNSFVKDEKECCEFLNFKILTSVNKKNVWLEISGADGVKKFLTSELEM
jgi:hypothetical protein